MEAPWLTLWQEARNGVQARDRFLSAVWERLRRQEGGRSDQVGPDYGASGVVQDVLKKVERALNEGKLQFDAPEKVLAWLNKVLRTTHLDVVMKKQLPCGGLLDAQGVVQDKRTGQHAATASNIVSTKEEQERELQALQQLDDLSEQKAYYLSEMYQVPHALIGYILWFTPEDAAKSETDRQRAFANYKRRASRYCEKAAAKIDAILGRPPRGQKHEPDPNL